MSERENILQRVREALRDPAPIPGSHHGESTGFPVSEAEAAPTISQWLPEVSESEAERFELFEKNSMDLRTDFRLLDSEEEVLEQLAGLAKTENWQKVAIHEGALTDRFRDKLNLPLLVTDGGYEATDLEQCDVGITECDALVAQTGSVLVTARSAGGRALSVLPPHHVVLVRRDQLLPDMPAAFTLLEQRYAPNYPSFISFITGPSRTGDIERILVLGAHGPKKLTVFCW
jgi:L-lactate dehydrogenase complex protein LldG